MAFVNEMVNVGVIMDGRALIVQCHQLHFTMDLRRYLTNMVQSTIALQSRIKLHQGLLLSPFCQWMFILARLILVIQPNSVMILHSNKQPMLVLIHVTLSYLETQKVILSQFMYRLSMKTQILSCLIL